MENSKYTKKAALLLREAGWLPGRSIYTSGSCSESQGAYQVLREFGNLSLRPRGNEVLEFGPSFESGPETDIPHRVISNCDDSIAKGIWDVVGEDFGFQIRNVAWELGGDEHAIGVDRNGVVYCATWRIEQASQIADADVMKLADSMNAYLNYWLDPRKKTRRALHAACPAWYERITFLLMDS